MAADERTPLLNGNSTAGYDEPSTEALLGDPEIEEGITASHCLAPEISEGPENAGNGTEENETKSPYMGGVSTTRFWVLFSCILLQFYVATFDSTLMSSSHPVITSYFNASNSASWLSTAFLLTSTAFQPLFGRLSDTIGRRPLHIFSLIMFACTTTWCALATSIGSFIAARACCGLGAGGVMAMGGILTNDLVPLERRGMFQSYINLFFGFGSVSGAALGGFLCEHIGWRWTFGIQVPPVLVMLAVACFATPPSLGPHYAKNSDKSALELIKGFDFAGSVLLSASVAFLILGLNMGGNVYPWRHPLVIGSLIASVFLFPLLVWVESRHVKPVMPMVLLSKPPRANLVFCNFFSYIGITAILFNGPLYFQAVKLESASTSGLRLAAPSAALMICGVLSGFVMTWTKQMKPLLVSGAVSMVIGGVCLTAMWDHIPSWLAMLFVIPPSLGQGLAYPATSLAILATSTQEDQAVATSTLTLWRNLGQVMGVAISSLIVQNALFADLAELVTGPHKAEIIWRVRKSVRAVLELSHTNQNEVILAYERSLTFTFAYSLAMFIITLMLLIPVKLPRLGKR